MKETALNYGLRNGDRNAAFPLTTHFTDNPMERIELIKKAAEVFSQHEKLETLYVTTDGQCFPQENDARAHALRMGPHASAVERMERQSALDAASGKKKSKEEHKQERAAVKENPNGEAGSSQSTPGDDQGDKSGTEGESGAYAKEAAGGGDAHTSASAANGGAGDGGESGGADAASRSEAPAKAAPKKAAKKAAKKAGKKK